MTTTLRNVTGRRLALLTAASALVVVGAGPPAAADVVDPLDLVHDEQVTGDVVTVGNAVLTCPDTPADANQECVAASRRENWFNNNRFAMRWADVDGDDATYNSSTARVRLPAGARVTYARLSWAGNRDGQQCGVGEAGSYPEGSAETDEVRLTVGGGPSRGVAPEDHTEDTTSVGHYSADAEVTDRFADLPVAGTARDVEVTVADVFAPEGRGCFGGWSLTLVHTDDDAGCDAQRREVLVYDGHVRQGVGDPPQSVTASGFRVGASTGAVRVGVTAYEGDNGQVGDRLRVGGTALADPVTGRADNFFAATAQGRVAPDHPNNFSVDAKRVDVPVDVVAAGDTEATLEVSTGAAGGADAFLLQGLTLSVPVPSLCLTRSVSPAVAAPGDTVTWTLEVRNPGELDATDVVVSDPAVPDCDETVGTLPAGDSTTVTCTSVVTEDLVNVATVSGTGPSGETLSAVGSAEVDVRAPAVADLEVTKTAVDETVVVGGRARWEITVRNTGDTPLTAVSATDRRVPACDRTLGSMGVGDERTYRCASTVREDVRNVVVATGEDPDAEPVRDADFAEVTAVDAPAGALAVTVTPDVGRTVPGEDVGLVVEVENGGDRTVTGLAVTTRGTGRCARRGWGSLAPSASRSFTCTLDATADDDLEVTTTARGRTGGRRVAATDTAVVPVLVPEVTVEVDVTAPVGTTPGSTEVRVRNAGETALRAARLRVEGTTGCEEPDRRFAADGRLTITCGAAVADVTARVSAQPVLGGLPVGPRVRDRDVVQLGGDAPAGDGPAPGAPGAPGYPGSPGDPGSPDYSSPGGVLPDTGAPRGGMPLAILGLGMVGAGGWLLGRGRPRDARPRGGGPGRRVPAAVPGRRGRRRR